MVNWNSNKRFPLAEMRKYVTILAIPIEEKGEIRLPIESLSKFCLASYFQKTVRKQINNIPHIIFVLSSGWELTELWSDIIETYSAVKISERIL